MIVEQQDQVLLLYGQAVLVQVAAGSNANPPIGGGGSYGADTFVGPTAPSYGTPGPVSSTRYFAGGGGGANQGPTSGSTHAGGVGGGGTGASVGPGK